MTRQEDKAKDANVILKDLDLTRQLPLGVHFILFYFFILFVLQDANVILKDLDLTQQLPLCVFMYFF